MMTPRIAIIGAGGLGGPVAYALAHGGARLLLCDDDVVELSNLQRQIQFTTSDVGRLKVEALADELARRGHHRDYVGEISQRFTADRAARLMQDVDVIIDCSDDFETKFAVNDQAVAARMPFVIGSVARYSGQLLVVDPRSWVSPEAAQGAAGCYRCLFEAPPATEDAETCADAGVLGAAVAVIAGLAARAALALARGPSPAGSALAGALWVVDDLRAAGASLALREVRYGPRPTCPACAQARRHRPSQPGSQGRRERTSGEAASADAQQTEDLESRTKESS